MPNWVKNLAKGHFKFFSSSARIDTCGFTLIIQIAIHMDWNLELYSRINTLLNVPLNSLNDNKM